MTPASVHSLVKQLEHKDGATAAHTWRVVLYTRAMAEHFALDGSMIERLTIAAAVHDVGKLEVPDEILKKAGPLTEREWGVMKLHTLWGEARLRSEAIDDPLILDLVRAHHERVDGAGYPDGLKGDEISSGARYFSVIDSFDAMTSIRPYRTEVGPAAAERAITELLDARGARYCDECVDAFVSLYRSGRIGWVLEYFNDRCELPDFGLIQAVSARASIRR
jgi:HD-GYP domain-containing protein (c-di-GMP phosphodiesterase class II)